MSIQYSNIPRLLSFLASCFSGSTGPGTCLKLACDMWPLINTLFAIVRLLSFAELVDRYNASKLIVEWVGIILMSTVSI